MFATSAALAAGGWIAWPVRMFADAGTLIMSFVGMGGVFVFSGLLFVCIRSLYADYGQLSVQVTAERDRILQLEQELQAKPEIKQKYVLDISMLLTGSVPQFVHATLPKGELVIPQFALTRMQEMANSGDELQQAQGIYALQMVERLRQESALPLTVLPDAAGQLQPYDEALLALAGSGDYILICNDESLAVKARHLGIVTLHMTEIEASIKAVYFSGQVVMVRIDAYGKDPGQGVATLADGSQVIVDGGADFLHQDMKIKIQRVYQTVSGTMIYGVIES
ncbi:MAG TPA: hypothetical protein PKL83_03535 [bacterium]|nr:hypothetical protein [bacterium]